MTTDRDDSDVSSGALLTAKLYGGAGNDKIRAPSVNAGISFVSGGEGNDKITSAPYGFGTEFNGLYGDGGDDIIYGGDDRDTAAIYGDTSVNFDDFDPLVGGNDIIYGGDGIVVDA